MKWTQMKMGEDEQGKHKPPGQRLGISLVFIIIIIYY